MAEFWDISMLQFIRCIFYELASNNMIIYTKVICIQNRRSTSQFKNTSHEKTFNIKKFILLKNVI